MSTNEPKNEEDWGAAVRVRVGTRRKIAELTDLMAVPTNSITTLPPNVVEAFRKAFAARKSFTPDVVIFTALHALEHMLTETDTNSTKKSRSRK